MLKESTKATTTKIKSAWSAVKSTKKSNRRQSPSFLVTFDNWTRMFQPVPINHYLCDTNQQNKPRILSYSSWNTPNTYVTHTIWLINCRTVFAVMDALRCYLMSLPSCVSNGWCALPWAPVAKEANLDSKLPGWRWQRSAINHDASWTQPKLEGWEAQEESVCGSGVGVGEGEGEDIGGDGEGGCGALHGLQLGDVQM